MTPKEVVTDGVRGSRITAELQKLAKRTVCASKAEDPVTSTNVQWRVGVEYLLYTLDRTVEESGGYCADWHARQSRKYVADLIGDISVRTPKDIIAWLDRREHATRLHLT